MIGISIFKALSQFRRILLRREKANARDRLAGRKAFSHRPAAGLQLSGFQPAINRMSRSIFPRYGGLIRSVAVKRACHSTGIALVKASKPARP
jgi:hypothetical protein